VCKAEDRKMIVHLSVVDVEGVGEGSVAHKLCTNGHVSTSLVCRVGRVARSAVEDSPV
jgi:hypothetical protein